MELPVKMSGHNLKIKKLTLKPVNREISDRTFRKPKTDQ
jgi:hypothetical protein